MLLFYFIVFCCCVIFCSKEEVEFLATWCPCRRARPRILITESISPSQWLKIVLQLFDSSVYRHWSADTASPMETGNSSSFNHETLTHICINKSRPNGMCTYQRPSAAVLWASVQVKTKESGQKTKLTRTMEAGLFSDKRPLRMKRRNPHLCLNR